MSIKRFAAIDVGSFELEMGIYEIDNMRGIIQIDRIRHVIALGRDTYNTGKISADLAEELCDILGEFVAVMKEYKVDAYRAYATSAMREAQNRVIILDQIKVRTGIDVKIISNSEQRFIGFKAIASKGKMFGKIIKEPTAIVDVGFGSTQITLYDKGHMISTQNLSLGVLRLREIISHIDAAHTQRIKTIKELVDNELATYRKLYLKDIKIKKIVAIGESILYMISRSGMMDRDGLIASSEYIKLYNKITAMTVPQIEDSFGVGKEFADVMIPCAIVYERLLKSSEVDAMWLPGTLLTDGIAAEYAYDENLIQINHDFTDDILSVSRVIASRYRDADAHGRCVEKYASDIFDIVRDRAGLTKRDGLLLEIATILHNCGKYVSMRNPSQSTYDIISSSEIIGLSHAERILVAQIARNGDDEFPYDGATMQIAKLTAILRLANSLDRSHKQKAIDYRFKIKDDKLVIEIDYDGDMILEKMSFDDHKRFFKEIFRLEPVLKQKKH